MEFKNAFIGFRTDTTAKAIIVAEAKSAGMSLSDYVLAATLKENASRATNRAGLPSQNQVAAEDSARRFGPRNEVLGAMDKPLARLEAGSPRGT